MSFLFDLLALATIGAGLYFLGIKYELERLTKITIGIFIVLVFFLVSIPLYANIFRFPEIDIIRINNIPILPNMTGSNFTINWPIYPIITDKYLISEKAFPLLFAIIIFLLYPMAIFLGYASALFYSKAQSKKNPTNYKTYSYEDVKSRARIQKDPKYCIVRYPDVHNNVNNLEEAVKVAINKLGGIASFVKRGDKVLIKSNICGGNPSISATFTSLEVVKYVVDMVREAGGEPFICDADMLWSKFKEAAKGEHWYEWAKKNKVDLVNLTETELVYFDFDKDTVFQHNEKPNQEIVSKRILDADVIISIPKMKTHLLTNVSLGMKNMYGTLPNEDKSYYHRYGIDELIYWINYAFTPILTIIDGSEGGEAEGPLAAHSVEFNTIIASNNVALADAVASKLMGFEQPFKDIKFLRCVQRRMGGKRSLLSYIPRDLYLTASQLISKWDLPKNSKDGKWERLDPQAVEETESFYENLLAFPGVATITHIGADFILLDASRLPYWKILETALLQLLFVPRFWAKKTKETTASKGRIRLNLAIFSLIALVSLFFFFYNGYHLTSLNLTSPDGYYLNSPNGLEDRWIKGLSDRWTPSLNSTLGYFIGFILAIAFGLIFSRLMKTKHLVAAILSSLFIAYFVESFAPHAAWWVYLHENLMPNLNGLWAPPLYPLFAIPIFIISIIGLSYVLRPFLFAIGTSLFAIGTRRFRLVPYAFIMVALFAFLYFDHYLFPPSNLLIPTEIMVIISACMAVLGLYYNEKNKLDWNLAVAAVAVVIGFTMEYFGAIAWFWGYPHTNFNYTDPYNLAYYNISNYIIVQLSSFNPTAYPNNPQLKGFNWLPIFVGFTWALNTWAVCGLARIFGIDLSEAFVKDEPFDAKDPMACKHEGDSLMADGKFEKALKHYENAIKIFRSSDESEEPDKSKDKIPDINYQLAEAFYGKGNALASMGDWRKSLEAYDEAITLYHNADSELAVVLHAQALYRKAVVIQNLEGSEKALEAYDKALDAYKQAMKTYPQAIDAYIDAWIDKALAFEQMGKFKDAMDIYKKAFTDIDALEPNRKLASNLLKAKILDFKGFTRIYWADTQGTRDDLYEDAIKDFNEAEKLGYQNDDKTWLIGAYWGIAYANFRQLRYKEVLEGQRHYKEALEAFSKCIIEKAKAKNAAFLWNDKGDMLLECGRFHAARSEEYKKKGDLEAAKKSCFKAREYYKDALETYEEAIDLSFELSNNLNGSLAWMGMKDLDTKISASAWEGKGYAHSCRATPLKDLSVETDSNEEENYAFKAYLKSIEFLDNLPKDSDARSGKGHILLKMFRFKEALKAYQDAIDIAGDDRIKTAASSLMPISLAKAYIGKGIALLKIGEREREEAKEAFKAAIGKAPKDTYYHWLAEKYYDQLRSKDSRAQGGIKIEIDGHIKGIEEKAKEARYLRIWQPRGAYLRLLR